MQDTLSPRFTPEQLSPKVFTPEQLEARAAWRKALRSGEYQQGQGCLKTGEGKFCCLGVLEAINDATFVNILGNVGLSQDFTVVGGTPFYYGVRAETAQRLGLTPQDMTDLVRANDGWSEHQVNFDGIANMIEAQEKPEMQEAA